MTGAEMRKIQEQRKKELQPLKKVITQYVGNRYDDLLDFFVNFARKRLERFFKEELEENTKN